jgi:hypothetical protein
MYVVDHRDEILSRDPGLSKRNVREILLEKFNGLDAKQKAVYTERLSKDQEEYKLKFKQFL